MDLIAARVAERAVKRAANQVPGLRFDLDLRPVLVRGDPDALERAIGNLVENALKWSPPQDVHGGRAEAIPLAQGVKFRFAVPEIGA